MGGQTDRTGMCIDPHPGYLSAETARGEALREDLRCSKAGLDFVVGQYNESRGI